MKLSKNLSSITYVYIILFAVYPRKDVVSGLALRGSENHRELQEDDECIYQGDVGWFNCNSKDFSCEEGYTCQRKPNTYVGVQCANITCVLNRIDDPVDPGDPTDPDDPDDPDLCWQGQCNSNSDCGGDSQCYFKDLSCACRDPNYTKCDSQGTEFLVPCSTTTEPEEDPTDTPTEAPTISPTPSPTHDPTSDPGNDSKSHKSKKYKGRLLSYLDDMKGNIPIQGVRGSR